MSDKKNETIVNVAKLKNDLSKYLRLAKQGKEVIVTEHKRPVAKMVPFLDGEEEIQLIPATLSLDIFRRLAKEGSVKRTWTALDMLLEDRKKR